MDESPETRLRELKAELAEIDFVLPGTINVAMNRCGKPTWTRKVSGKTVTRRFTREQAERYQPWLENRRRLRELVSELEALSLRTAEQAEGWDRKRRPKGQGRPGR
jgi:hypothetical protein